MSMRRRSMLDLKFDNAKPQHYLWVSAGGSVNGDGSKDRPFNSIQEAVDHAKPGTAILVKTGTYTENVKLPTKGGGQTDAPLWLVSVDGPQKAKIVAKTDTLSTLYGFGTDNVIIKGFSIEGGKNGIQFSQSGSDFSNLASNIVIEDNLIRNTIEDGIKISQGRNIEIVGNNIMATGNEGIDLVAVNDSIVKFNDVAGTAGAGSIVAKGGSTNVSIDANHIAGSSSDGIVVGGWTGDAYFVPGFSGYEAANITVTNNYVADVLRRPVNLLGAVDSTISANYLVGNKSYYTGIGIGSGNPQAQDVAHSARDKIFNNIMINNSRIISSSDSIDLICYNNNESGLWNILTGNDAYKTQRPLGLKIDTFSLPIHNVIFGHAGDDKITGAKSGETIKLYSGNDTCDGRDGDDKIFGGAGSDKLIGGHGRDYLYGGSGSDTFVYRSQIDSTAAASGRDSICDFETRDKIDLSAIDANKFTSGNQAFKFIGVDHFHGGPGELRFQVKGSDTYIYGDIDGDQRSDFSLHIDQAISILKDYLYL